MIALSVRTERFTLAAPLRASWGELREREVLVVRLDFPDGLWGEGEAAPLEPYDGVSMASVREALDAYADVLRGLEPTADVLEACRVVSDLPQALAGIDLALWDHASRRTGTPLARLIDPRAVGAVPVNATIGVSDRARAAEAAAAAAREGFRCVKVKVGIGDDAGRLAAVRAAVGPEVGIRVDANGAWGTVEVALESLAALEPVGLELCEEPVHGAELLRAVQAGTKVPIAMDETHAPGAGGVRAVCLKITRGGITGVLADARAARAAGADVYLASTFDGPRGIAAAVHTAAALRVTRSCGLATLTAAGALAPQAGVIQVPQSVGLA
ncbi:mandelate racemase/muconate lactonizing enzyme family protein [Solirubrobacter phytolaccae]|uniref:Mandelate racemase/muconate lactonizing enzyme family protein n=1 Tax=Solirubrobacter phytolaccae TaxID=1404360 RepID=A0A9X3NA20_9ACTN|nr:mandelate racemase/muconate lactonizing enzyme family protein [Solirubrobacter phytolaccae]MDA0180967.1 mandelate racemase/muconate lactonizing enzyme family protein [Solirubrobacter phytolaccae]